MLMAMPSFAQQTTLHENRDLSESVEEFEAKGEARGPKEPKEPKEPLRSQTPLMTKVTGAPESNTASPCTDCAVASRETMTLEERRQLRRDIHEAGRKIYPRHSRTAARYP